MVGSCTQKPIKSILKKPSCEPIQKIDDFHKDFFDFRASTQINSNLEGASPIELANDENDDKNYNEDSRYKSMKIKDIFDDMTNKPVLDDRSCNRTIKFDNINSNEYNVNYGATGMYITRDNWKYDDDNVNNGGLQDGLRGFDYEYDNHIRIKDYGVDK